MPGGAQLIKLGGDEQRSGMRLKGLGKALLGSGAASLSLYGAAALLSSTVHSHLHTMLLFLALVGLVAGSVLYLLSRARGR